MKCPSHITREVAGYCCVCGSFYCEDCLTRHEGNLYCRKHYKPIGEKIEREQKLQEGRKRRARQSLVIQFKNGQQAQGVSRTMNLRDTGFHLECEDNDGVATGQTIRVRFEDVRCVCHVKSYNGDFNASESDQEYAPGGSDVIVEFRDGEILRGKTLNLYNPDHPRFYVIPDDPASNNINVLVEQSAVQSIYSPEAYEEKVQAVAAAEKAVPSSAKEEGNRTVSLEQEESMGDFYFEQRNYLPAVEQYRLAYEKHPGASRIRRKLIVTTINVGIGHIKGREYPDALRWMKRALELDPENEHAKKKEKQLRRVIEKTQRRMQAYLDGSLVTDVKKRKK